MDIGFIGLGVMGSSMARNLLQAGHNLTVYNRTKGKAEELLSLGA
ncbi:MAG: NAD(P)-binding domain-containing protein, partial [Alkalispirochaetaceae bacterium]